MRPRKLPRSFYRRPDVVQLSRQLLGKVLCTRIDGQPLTSGIITETEAYCGRGDRASHASGGRRTARTETMYRAGGIGYIYLCYGIHHLFNAVTNEKGKADAVLVRAVKPLDGTPTMLERRKADTTGPGLTAGPGRLTQALGITTDRDGVDLSDNTIWIEDRGDIFSNKQIITSSRIGVDYAGEDAERPWRFYPAGSRWVSSK